MRALHAPPAVALLAVALLASCGESESEREERAMAAAVPPRLEPDGTIRLTDADRRALGLAVTEALAEDLPDVTLRLGRVRARLGDEALVVAPVSGRIVRAPAAALGALVTAGDAVVQITPTLATAERISMDVQAAQFQGQIEATARELATREAEAVRARDLARGAIVSAERLQQAELAVATTRARLQGLERSRGAQAQGERTAVALRAPAGGTLVALDASLGAMVRAGDVVARILQAGPRWVDVATAPDEPTGDGYEVAAGPAWVSARLLARGAIVEDDGTRRDRLVVDAVGAVPLLPGATVAVRVAHGAPRGTVVPEAALVPDAGGDVVYVEVRPNLFAARAVRVAARFHGRARLAAGLHDGERVVTVGAMALRGESLRGALRHQE